MLYAPCCFRALLYADAAYIQRTYAAAYAIRYTYTQAATLQRHTLSAIIVIAPPLITPPGGYAPRYKMALRHEEYGVYAAELYDVAILALLSYMAMPGAQAR